MTSSTSSALPFEAAGRLEIERLIGVVAQRHNVLISPDDPIFMTVTLNELILAGALERLQAAITAGQDQIAAGTAQQIAAAKITGERLITAAADHVAGQVRTAGGEAAGSIRAAVAAELGAARQASMAARKAASAAWWAAMIAVAATAIAATLTVVSPLVH